MPPGLGAGCVPINTLRTSGIAIAILPDPLPAIAKVVGAVLLDDPLTAGIVFVAVRAEPFVIIGIDLAIAISADIAMAIIPLMIPTITSVG